MQRLREASGINRAGVSMLGISEAAEKVGFRTTGSKVTLEQLRHFELPAILHWDQSHFVVLYGVKLARQRTKQVRDTLEEFNGIKGKSYKEGGSKYYVADPAMQKV